MAKVAPDRTKVVIRKLPPLLPEADLKSAVDAVCHGQYNWFSFVPGKNSNKSSRHARAYLNFQEPLQVYDFRAAFDGHIFVNEKGTQFRCLVEYAPYQRVPRKLSKRDPREGTLEKDADYQEFVSNLDKEPELLPSVEAQAGRLAAAAKVAQPTEKRVTPLMQYLQDKWSGRLSAAPLPRGPARQKQKKKGSIEDIAPPPGFDPLPSGGKPPPSRSKATSKQSSSTAKSKLEAAQDAAAAALQGMEIASTKAKPAKHTTKKKPRTKQQGPGSSEASPAALKPPTRLLKKEQGPPERGTEETTSTQAREGRASESEEGPSTQESAASRKGPAKPVRMRAGFQVYTPRNRNGDAAAPEEQAAAAVDVAGTGNNTEHGSAQTQPDKRANNRRSRPPRQRSSKSGESWQIKSSTDSPATQPAAEGWDQEMPTTEAAAGQPGDWSMLSAPPEQLQPGDWVASPDQPG